MAGFPPEVQQYLNQYEQAAVKELRGFTEVIDAGPVPGMLYHYTDDKGLYGILTSGKLWLNDAQLLTLQEKIVSHLTPAVTADWLKHAHPFGKMKY